MINELAITAQEVAAEVTRIAEGRTLRGNETLQRLLIYLADRTLDGSAAALREHTIGVEVFGKPADYTPQEDASVRVQIGRLRLKLEEYYRAEGVDDPVVIELPKRQFALHFRQRAGAPAVAAAAPATDLPGAAAPTSAAASEPAGPTRPPTSRRWSWPSLLVGALLATLAWGGSDLWRSREAGRPRPSAVSVAPEVGELWRPFLTGDRPVTVAITMRPFLRYDHGVIYDWSLKGQHQEAQESRVAELKRQLNTRVLVPWESTYTTFGEAAGIFLLARLFEGRLHDLQLRRHDTLTWDEIAEQNVIFMGAGKYNVPFERIPVAWAFEQPGGGSRIVNLHPRDGEPSEFITPIPTAPDFLQTEDYALISLVPGLHGKGKILAFGATSSPGLWAAVQYMTDARYARELVGQLESGEGTVPDHYQVVIHARFQSLVPVEIKYVTHRAL